MQKQTKAAARMWRVELESGEAFTVTAETRGEAIKKGLAFRPRATRLHKCENVAALIAAGKI